jgi:hypothetical protein
VIPIHEFGGHHPGELPGNSNTASVVPAELVGVRQLAHVQGGRLDVEGATGVQPVDVEEFVGQGFRPLDEAMKRYFSGVRVPMKDGYRYMRVKIAGGDKSLMIWNDELVGGRARLPVAAIDRTGWEFNSEKYSPADLPMALRYLSREGDRVAKVFRPTPFLVNYDLVIWAERKRDAEAIAHQLLVRFTPLADFRMFDGRLNGTVVLKYDGSTDASDKEIGFDQHASVRYELSLTAESWLPLPEVVVPTILGKVTAFQEESGELLLQQVGGLVV